MLANEGTDAQHISELALHLLPHRHQTDGFFALAMQRRS
jgi:16S rRNA C967 or C1407 C5-methylase (RsmB/RsmF family)